MKNHGQSLQTHILLVTNNKSLLILSSHTHRQYLKMDRIEKNITEQNIY